MNLEILLPDVLEWKYGCVADTASGKIIAWRHPTKHQPTQEQLEIDLQEFILISTREKRIKYLWDACHKHQNKYISESALAFIYSFIGQSDTEKHNKAIKVRDWVSNIWSEYKDARDSINTIIDIATISNKNIDFDKIGPIPYSIWYF
jgi:hypothetical protein